MTPTVIQRDEVEIAMTKFYGWGWHCYRCDLTTLNLESLAAAETSVADHLWGSAVHRDNPGPS